MSQSVVFLLRLGLGLGLGFVLGESNVWCKTDGVKEDREPNGYVGIEETVVQMAKGMECVVMGMC